MIPGSGIATVYLETFGLIRVDDGGLRFVRPDEGIGAKDYPKVEALLLDAFRSLDSAHATAREVVEGLPKLLDVPQSFLEVISITNEGPLSGPKDESFVF